MNFELHLQPSPFRKPTVLKATMRHRHASGSYITVKQPVVKRSTIIQLHVNKLC